MAGSPGAVAPFDDEGIWLRCNFHAHTTESDGWLQPALLRRYYAAAGYDVLAITDHDMLTPTPAGNDNMLILGGTELGLRAPQSGGPLHILGIGIEQQPDVGHEASLSQATSAIRASGGLAFVAHPVWSGLRTDELGLLEGVTGIEIFNGNVEVEQGRGHANAHWDIWLAMGAKLGGIATDDLHRPGFDGFRAWTMVRAKERTREAVLAALAEGRYYATTGPRITELTWQNETLTVRTTPVRSIVVAGKPSFGCQVKAGHHEMAFNGERLRTIDGQALEGTSDGDLLTGAIFHSAPRVQFLRVVVTDAAGRMAWSNPIWV